eukprot:9456421-Ditylum_brightwellii.AAC.1
MNIAWVKAHQDDVKPICELSIDAQLNCIAEKDAELFCLNAPDHLSPVGAPPVLPLNHAYIRKAGLNDATIDKIDWSALGENLQRQHLFNQIRLVKFMHNWLHVGKRKHLMNITDIGVCPACSTDHKTWMHLYHCKDANSVAIHTLPITKFHATLLKCKTAPIIRDVLTLYS